MGVNIIVLSMMSDLPEDHWLHEVNAQRDRAQEMKRPHLVLVHAPDLTREYDGQTEAAGHYLATLPSAYMSGEH